MIAMPKPHPIYLDPDSDIDPSPEDVLDALIAAAENAYTDGEYKTALLAKMREWRRQLTAINDEFLI